MNDNGNGIAVVNNPTPVSNKTVRTQPKEKVISVKRLEKVAKVIEEQAGGLLAHLRQIQNFAQEAVDELPFSQQSEIDAIRNDLGKIVGNLETLQNEANEQLSAVEMALERQFKAKLDKLEKLKAEIADRWSKAKAAAKLEVEKDKTLKAGSLNQEKTQLENKIRDLETVAKGEKILRKAAISHNFSRLSTEIEDRKQSANKRLWTSVETTADAEEVMEVLPDAVSFRSKVTPKLFVGIFNEFVDLTNKQLPSKLKCKHCGSDRIQADPRYGYMSCNTCGRKDVADTSAVVGTLNLPTLSDIINVKEATPESKMLEHKDSIVDAVDNRM